MEYTRTNQPNFSLASISGHKTEALFALLTADFHTKNTAQTQALALVYAEALLSGAGKYTREQFLDAVSKLGASIEVTTGNGRLTIALRGVASSDAKLLRLLGTMLSEPTFAEDELKRIKTLVANQLTQHEEDARELARENLVNELFTPSDRRHSAAPQKLVSLVKQVQVADLRAFHERILATHFAVSAAAPEPTLAALTKTLSTSLDAREESTATTTAAHQTKTPHNALLLQHVPSRQNIEYSIGGPLPITLHHPDFLPFVFGLAVLAKWGGFAGRLMSIVREKEGLTYGIYGQAETVSGTEVGYWRIMTFFSPEASKQGLTSTAREIKRIYQHGITTAEYDRFRDILHTQQMLLHDSATRAVTDLHTFHVAGFTIEEMKTHKEQLLAVTREQVNQALRTYLTPASVIISGAGPIKSVQKSLRQEFGNGIM